MHIMFRHFKFDVLSSKSVVGTFHLPSSHLHVTPFVDPVSFQVPQITIIGKRIEVQRPNPSVPALLITVIQVMEDVQSVFSIILSLALTSFLSRTSFQRPYLDRSWHTSVSHCSIQSTSLSRLFSSKHFIHALSCSILNLITISPSAPPFWTSIPTTTKLSTISLHYCSQAVHGKERTR